MRSEFRDAVCVARYGGEEFAIITLMPLENAADCLDRLRSTIARTEFRHEDTVIPVTLSGGVAQIAGDDKIGKVVRRSDEALYAAKLGGRNRIYLHDGSLCRLVTKVALRPPAIFGSTPCPAWRKRTRPAESKSDSNASSKKSPRNNCFTCKVIFRARLRGPRSRRLGQIVAQKLSSQQSGKRQSVKMAPAGERRWLCCLAGNRLFASCYVISSCG